MNWSDDKIGKLIPDKFLPKRMVKLKMPLSYDVNQYLKSGFGEGFRRGKDDRDVMVVNKSNPYLMCLKSDDYFDNLYPSENVHVRILNKEAPFSTSDDWVCLGSYRLDL